MKLKFLVLTLFTVLMGFAQEKATINGTVTDNEMDGAGLAFASVNIKNTTVSTTTDENGAYTFKVDAGTYTLVFDFLGYETKEVEVTVAAGETKTIDQPMGASSVELNQVVIESTVSREKESALLAQQKNAVEMKQAIGAQELSRKGIGDVATAVAKTSGISKQEGSNNVYVRGLGDRYNSTSMNGLPIPSNDPEKKNIFLDIFTTDIVDVISIDKVYNTKLFGDFAGGNVDIISKEYRGDGMLEVSVGAKGNTNALNKSGEFFLQDGPGKFGFTNNSYPSNALTGFNFSNSLNPTKESPYAGSFGFKAGESYNIGEQGKLSLFATASYSNSYDFREGINQNVSAQGAEIKSFNQERFQYNTNTTGMFNAAYRINDNNKISYNLLFVNSSDQFRDTFSGFIRDIAEDDNGLMQRGTYVKNSLMINQLIGSHKIDSLTTVDWGASYNTVKGDMPDRTQNTLKNVDGVWNIAQITTTDNHRYYQKLTEDELAARIAITRKLGVDENGEARGNISAGYNGRFKQRDFEAIQFNFRLTGSAMTTPVDPNNLDAFFNQNNYSSGLFSIEAFAGMTPQTYSGDQDIHAGFVNADYRLTDKLTASVGLRYERITQTVNWRTQLEPVPSSNTFNRNEFLPNLILKYELNDKQNLRFAASKTYTLPQFKERSPFVYEDVTEIKFGNPYLYPSTDYNVDLKWEFFPENDELFSATVFGKLIEDPINEVNLASSTNDISWVNISDQGTVYGIEIEARKNLFSLDTEFTNKLSFGFNASYMQTQQDLDAEKVRTETQGRLNTNFTNTESSFTGASDFLLNADLSYTRNWNADSGITATVMYSHYSDRLYALGIEQKGNLVDKGMGALDFVVKSRLGRHFGVDLVTRNLLNPEFQRIQQNASGYVPAVTFKRGTYVGIGVTYKL
ncbi:TonB-dependent receptor [Flavobacterium akiainvivens]|uniref:TonB-dependent receptor n=1 Tax=Flavobacterium akiainvivens TaxID=1202724 RepID=A0A0M8MDK8_9FLAO|nr:TonB-dependent receptor [Flavobacterium akiainvivens]KOS06614.1 TonB-dependent receptor [Flavobacterium akiainvivens]